jgi:hypothetical protein
MKRLTYPIAAVAVAAFIGCGSTATPPMAQEMAPPAVEAQTTLTTATLNVTGMQ